MDGRAGHRSPATPGRTAGPRANQRRVGDSPCRLGTDRRFGAAATGSRVEPAGRGLRRRRRGDWCGATGAPGGHEAGGRRLRHQSYCNRVRDGPGSPRCRGRPVLRARRHQHTPGSRLRHRRVLAVPAPTRRRRRRAAASHARRRGARAGDRLGSGSQPAGVGAGVAGHAAVVALPRSARGQPAIGSRRVHTHRGRGAGRARRPHDLSSHLTLAVPVAPGGGARVVTAARTWDAVVVGAGPAGSIVAHGLSRAGATVLLVDRAAFPRPKVCGCCLNGRALAALDDSGLSSRLAELRPHPYDALRLRAWRAEASLSLPGGASVSRERFDAMLIEAAAGQGTQLMLGTRATLVGRNAGLSTVALEAPHDAHTTVQCRVVIVATGLGSPFALRELGGELVTAGSRLGASTVLASDARVPWLDHTVNMTVGANGYMGAVRLEDGRWNLAAALDAYAVARAKGVGPVVRGVLACIP